MGIEYRQKVLALAQQKGPILPTDVAKLLKVETITAGAMLSEMVENKLLHISSIKVGGSPLYYLPGSSPQLERFVERLNPKDRAVFDMLRERHVLRDAEQDVLTRFSLRQLRDFARPLHVSHGTEAELFWRFHSVSEEDALAIVAGKKPRTRAPVQPAQSAVEPVHREQAPRKPRVPRAKKVYVIEEDVLFKRVFAYCKPKDMTLQNVKVITKKRELEGEVLVPKDASYQKYYFRARDKKSVSDTDVAAVYGQSAVKKMPAFFFITGKLTKKAEAARTNYPSLSIASLPDGS